MGYVSLPEGKAQEENKTTQQSGPKNQVEVGAVLTPLKKGVK